MSEDPNIKLATRIAHAAWMSILLGLLIEIALIATAAWFGKADKLSPFIADLAGKTSWSVLVCVGLSIGTAASGARGPVMGLLGALSAPMGFAVAKAAHKSAAQALDVAMAASTSGPTSGQMIAIRGIEYAILGLAVGQISRKSWGTFPVYAALGLTTGITAAAVILSITLRTAATPPPTFALVSKSVNEVLFPVGCSIVLYALNALGKRVRLAVAV